MAPYVFDWEHGIALYAMQGNRASSPSEGKSHGFSRVAVGTWDIFSTYGTDHPSKLVFVQRCQDSCLVMRDTSGISSRLGRAIQMLLEVRREAKSPLLVAAVILGFLSIFSKSQSSSSFETLRSACLSSCQRDVRPPVQMRRGLKAFSRVATVDSDIHSSCEMKDEPAFKQCREIRPSLESGHLGAHST